jgi:hypothetical protein
MHKILLKPEKESGQLSAEMQTVQDHLQTKGWKCKVIVDSGSTDNLVSTEMVENWSWRDN